MQGYICASVCVWRSEEILWDLVPLSDLPAIAVTLSQLASPSASFLRQDPSLNNGLTDSAQVKYSEPLVSLLSPGITVLGLHASSPFVCVHLTWQPSSVIQPCSSRYTPASLQFSCSFRTSVPTVALLESRFPLGKPIISAMHNHALTEEIREHEFLKFGSSPWRPRPFVHLHLACGHNPQDLSEEHEKYHFPWLS